MPTMNVGLTAELAAYVGGEVASGEYGTASEVVRDALRLPRREREAHEEKIAILRRDIRIGLDDIEAGRISTRSVRDVVAATRAAAGEGSDRARAAAFASPPPPMPTSKPPWPGP